MAKAKLKRTTLVSNPTEAEESDTLMQWMKFKGIKFTHVKNETGRPDASGRIRNWKALWDAQDGVSPGFPDFVIALPKIGLLCIELKRKKGSKTSIYQLDWIEALNSIPGVCGQVCHGADAAIELISLYLPK